MLKVWYNSSSLWKFCNKIVHGATVTKKKEKTPTESCQQLTEENISYEKDPFLIVSPQLNSLFFKKPLYFPLKLHTPHPNATNHMSPTSNTVDNIMGASLVIHSGTVTPLPKPPHWIDARKVDYDPR
jgi:hypothetical protein